MHLRSTVCCGFIFFLEAFTCLASLDIYRRTSRIVGFTPVIESVHSLKTHTALHLSSSSLQNPRAELKPTRVLLRECEKTIVEIDAVAQKGDNFKDSYASRMFSIDCTGKPPSLAYCQWHLAPYLRPLLLFVLLLLAVHARPAL